ATPKLSGMVPRDFVREDEGRGRIFGGEVDYSRLVFRLIAKGVASHAPPSPAAWLERTIASCTFSIRAPIRSPSRRSVVARQARFKSQRSFSKHSVSICSSQRVLLRIIYPVVEFPTLN